MAHHGVQGVHRAERQQSGRTRRRTPHQRVHHRVGGVLGHRLHHRTGDLLLRQLPGVAAAEVGEPLPRGRQVAGLQRFADRPRLADQGRAAEHSPGGPGGEQRRPGRGGAQSAVGAPRRDGDGTHAQRGEDHADIAPVPPHQPLQRPGRPPEPGHRMSAPGIAEGSVGRVARCEPQGGRRPHRRQPKIWAAAGTTAGGGDVTEARMAVDVLTQGPRPGSTNRGRESPGFRIDALPGLPAAAATWTRCDRRRGRRSRALPGDSGGTAPDWGSPPSPASSPCLRLAC